MFVRACVCVCLFACLFACLCVCVCPLLAYASSACPCACHATVVPVQGGRRSHQAPVYVRALFDYNADEDAWMPCVNGGTSFAKGDILEVFALTIMERQSVCARVCVRACVCVRVCACVCRSLPSPFPLSVPIPNVHACAWLRSWIKPTTSGGKRESAAMRCVMFFFFFFFVLFFSFGPLHQAVRPVCMGCACMRRQQGSSQQVVVLSHPAFSAVK